MCKQHSLENEKKKKIECFGSERYFCWKFEGEWVELVNIAVSYSRD